MSETRQLKKRFTVALLAVLVALAAISAATFAWYVYNTRAHTTKLEMAAGSSKSLLISNTESGPYGSSAVLESFTSFLNPVSSNVINGGDGFQKVMGYTNGSDGEPTLIANLFGPAAYTDYYHSSLYIKSTGSNTDLYLANIGFEDNNETYKISTAIRIGLVVHPQGGGSASEYIFEINKDVNPERKLNTYNEAASSVIKEEGWVLDGNKKDGHSLVEFTPYDKSNFCAYDETTTVATPTASSVKLATLAQADVPVKVDVYIWLEGCDGDCTNSLCGMTLSNIALVFGGY